MSGWNFKWVLIVLLLSGCCSTTVKTITTTSSSSSTVIKSIDLKAAITVTTKRDFYILTMQTSFFPKETKYFDLTFNGVYWNRYLVSDEIWLIKVKDFPTTVCLTPIDAKGNTLESATMFTL